MLEINEYQKPQSYLIKLPLAPFSTHITPNYCTQCSKKVLLILSRNHSAARQVGMELARLLLHTLGIRCPYNHSQGELNTSCGMLACVASREDSDADADDGGGGNGRRKEERKRQIQPEFSQFTLEVRRTNLCYLAPRQDSFTLRKCYL